MSTRCHMRMAWREAQHGVSQANFRWSTDPSWIRDALPPKSTLFRSSVTMNTRMPPRIPTGHPFTLVDALEIDPVPHVHACAICSHCAGLSRCHVTITPAPNNATPKVICPCPHAGVITRCPSRRTHPNRRRHKTQTQPGHRAHKCRPHSMERDRISCAYLHSLTGDSDDESKEWNSIEDDVNSEWPTSPFRRCTSASTRPMQHVDHPRPM